MNIWSHLPRNVRLFLLEQPLPEGWKRQIDATLTQGDTGDTAVISNKVEMGNKHNYNMLAALIILVLSAFILFAIAN